MDVITVHSRFADRKRFANHKNNPSLPQSLQIGHFPKAIFNVAYVGKKTEIGEKSKSSNDRRLGDTSKSIDRADRNKDLDFPASRNIFGFDIGTSPLLRNCVSFDRA